MSCPNLLFSADFLNLNYYKAGSFSLPPAQQHLPISNTQALISIVESKAPYVSHSSEGDNQIGGEGEERKDSQVQHNIEIMHTCNLRSLRLRQEDQEEAQGQPSYIRP